MWLSQTLLASGSALVWGALSALSSQTSRPDSHAWRSSQRATAAVVASPAVQSEVAAPDGLLLLHAGGRGICWSAAADGGGAIAGAVLGALTAACRPASTTSCRRLASGCRPPAPAWQRPGWQKAGYSWRAACTLDAVAAVQLTAAVAYGCGHRQAAGPPDASGIHRPGEKMQSEQLRRSWVCLEGE